MCSCLEQLHPNKRNTNIPHRILNNCNLQLDLLTPLVHSHKEDHISPPTPLLTGLDILQYFESCKLKAILHPPHLADFYNRCIHMFRHTAQYYEDKHSVYCYNLICICNELPFPSHISLISFYMFPLAIILKLGR